MGYIGIFLIPLMIVIIIIMLLPEVTKKNGIVTIGTLINKKYDLYFYNLAVHAEKRRDIRGRSYWCVCVYAYEKSAPHVQVRMHLLPVSGFAKSAQKKKNKVEKIINS